MNNELLCHLAWIEKGAEPYWIPIGGKGYSICNCHSYIILTQSEFEGYS